MSHRRKHPLTRGQKKLASLGIILKPFPVTTVGSLPLPTELKEMRYRVLKGVQPESELRRRETLAAETWVRTQEKLGMDVLVDGELNRGDMISCFSERIEGFESAGTVRAYGNRYYKRPVIVGSLRSTGPIVQPFWRHVSRYTHRPMKAVVTGPYTLMDWSFDAHYGSRKALLKALTGIIRSELVALVESGAKIIQLDEPALTSHPEEFPLVREAMQALVSKLEAYFILHHCYEDIGPLWPQIERLPFDNFSLEATNSQDEVLRAIRKHRTKKDISLGLTDSHNHTAESPSDVAKRMRAALKVIPSAQLWPSTDCGLRTRTVEEAQEKLSALSKAAEAFRQATR